MYYFMSLKRIAHTCIALTIVSIIYSLYLRIQITIIEQQFNAILFRLDRHDEHIFTLEKRIK